MERQMVEPMRRDRRVVATYTSYDESQRAVDYLSDQKFPVERVAIVAEGLRFVEQVTGRLNWGRALMNGLLSGALIGAFVGLLFSIFTVGLDLFAFLLYGVIAGAVIGAIFNLIGYALSSGRRDFTSIGGIQAERYSVMVDVDVAAEAERLLAGLQR
ncbi:general stress protein [Kallotenue papyrolyticum]|uniref:general stress protein n=1 Tax=Kallotenue papyrolyticum TaxID=1325125 RepID=UPI000492E327|nr:general stress protein [Kallotenue papyrolyticum]